MALSFTVNCANAMLFGLKNHIGSGDGKLVLRVYAGSVPSNADASLSTGNAVIATFQFDPPFSGDPANKILTILPFPPTTVSTTGTATFFRLGKTATNSAFLQGSVSEAGGTGDLKLNKIALTQGEDARVIEVKFQLP